MAYLIDNPPAIRQWYDKRNRPLTGCTVLHTAEGVLDTVGPDTGAENTADFIRRRTTAGSYHDLVDSDSWVPLIPYRHGAFHDGTGSNNWALSISFACRTSDWRAMSPEKRRGFLRQGARAFAAQQAWRRANGFPTTELRLITKAQSDAGMSGFIYHGLRDPGRRTDPGVAAPNLFPFDDWLAECRAALSGTTTAPPTPAALGDDTMKLYIDNKGSIWKATDFTLTWVGSPESAELLGRGAAPMISVTEGELGKIRAEIQGNCDALMLKVTKAAGGDVDEAAIIAGLAPKVSEALSAVLAGAGRPDGSLTRDDVLSAVREVFGSAAAKP